MAPSTMPLLHLEGVCRDYPSGEGLLTVLDTINLSIEAGEMLAIVGTSGSGKSRPQFTPVKW